MRKIVLLPEEKIPAALEELKLAMKEQKDHKLFVRYQVIYMLLSGESYEKIMDYTGLSLAILFNYRKAYCEKGIAGLVRKKQPGRERFLTAEQEEQVVSTIVNQTPKDVGFPVEMNWTAPLIRDWIERTFDVSFSVRGTRDLLYRLGLSYTKPTYTLEKANPLKQAAFLEVFEQVKKLINGQIDRILFEDESMIRDYQAISNTWFPKGHQKIIPTFGQHQGVKLIGTLDYETGEVFCVQEERYTAVEFLSFLEKVIIRYPNERIVMVLDNARIHHAKYIQPFLEKHQHQLEFLFLPPYSPHFNLIEGLWKWMKATVIHNVFFPNVGKIRNAVQGFIQIINQTPENTVNRLCLKL